MSTTEPIRRASACLMLALQRHSLLSVGFVLALVAGDSLAESDGASWGADSSSVQQNLIGPAGIQQTALLQTPAQYLARDLQYKAETINRVDLPAWPSRMDASQSYQVHPLYQELVPGNLSRPPRRGFTPIRAQGFEPYFRLNYLIGFFPDPQSTVIGGDGLLVAPGFTTGLSTTPTAPFPVVFNGAPLALPPTSPLPSFGTPNGIPVTTSSFGIDHVSGIEGIMGIPLGNGTLEIGGLAFAQADDTETFRATAAAFGLSPALLPAIRFTNNGAPAANLAIPFEEVTFRSVIDSWGAGVEYLLDPLTPNQAYSFAPTIGFKYFKYRETFGFSGRYTDPTVPDPTNPLVNVTLLPTLTSEATNHIFGPTFGMRFDLPGPHVSLSFLPRVGLAVNRTITKIDSSQLFLQAQADSDYERESELSPFLEFDANATLHVNQSLSFFAGYKLLAFTRVRRSEEQVVYDSIAGAANVGISGDTTELVVHSLMVGGEFTFGRPSTGHPTNNRYR